MSVGEHGVFLTRELLEDVSAEVVRSLILEHAGSWGVAIQPLNINPWRYIDTVPVESDDPR